jgi:hypothetical protein
MRRQFQVQRLSDQQHLAQIRCDLAQQPHRRPGTPLDRKSHHIRQAQQP